ncbi:MAG: hypothetical protein QOE46_2931 [Acidobacteriota bacterium]|jgi:hypothetical protein|nr:hypothetical protein [Acidobacteriota bacterium]
MPTYEPSHAPISTWESRFFFFQYIRQIAPEVLEELRGVPFDLYSITFPPNRWHALENEYGRWWYVFEDDTYPRDPSIYQLRDSLNYWSEKFNLRDEWCIKQAFRTLDQWYQNSRFADALMWGREAYGYMPPVGLEEGKFTFTFHRWDTVAQSRGEYQREVEQAFRQYRIEYCDRIEELTRERDYVEQKKKRDTTHFAWLAWYQVKNKPQSWICKEFNATRSTVAEAIKGAAAICNLSLRKPTSAGRPRKTDS